MKALIFDEPNKPVVSDVQAPSITDNEVMIRSRLVGICHSDYELLAGQYIIDPYRIPISAEAATGPVPLTVGMYDLASGQRLPSFASDGTQIGDTIHITDVEIQAGG